MPERLKEALNEQLVRARLLHEKDIAGGVGAVYLPHALARKFPNASKEFGWKYLFPSVSTSKDPRSGEMRRHHVNESNIQKAVKKAASIACIDKRVTVHTLRHSFAPLEIHTLATPTVTFGNLFLTGFAFSHLIP